MTDTSSHLLKIDLSDGSTFSFINFDDLSSWIEKERAAFNWLAEGGAQAGAGVTDLRQNFLLRHKTLNARLKQWQSSPENNELREQFANAFRDAYSSTTSVRSDHQFARIASEIAAKDGPIAGSAALGTLLGSTVKSHIELYWGSSKRLLKDRASIRALPT